MTDRELSPEIVAEMLRRGDAQLVDVREPYEHDTGRIAGARHVELGALAAEAETIQRDKPVVFYCRVGARSAMATQAFAASGWDAYNLSGGIVGWVMAGQAIEGEVAEH
ncbi:MAG TPA: rhodanese-like domain-containing protein [Thermoleophilaceae bacterium]|jgi:rhodanese-related sulfurtransferase